MHQNDDTGRSAAENEIHQTDDQIEKNSRQESVNCFLPGFLHCYIRTCGKDSFAKVLSKKDSFVK